MKKTQRLLVSLLVCCFVLAAIPALAGTSGKGSNSLELTQIYVNGGNTSAPYKYGYLEIFNAGPVDIDLSNWTIQYQTATSVSGFGSSNTYYLGKRWDATNPYWSSATNPSCPDATTPGQALPAQIYWSPIAANSNNPFPCYYNGFNGTIKAGQFILVQIGGQSAGVGALTYPISPDIVLGANTPGGTTPHTALALSATGAKVAVVSTTSSITCTGTKPPQTGPFDVDLVGYMNTTATNTSCYEGTGSAVLNSAGPGSKNSYTIWRGTTTTFGDPCASDNDDNKTDFNWIQLGPSVTNGWLLHNSTSVYTSPNGSGSPTTATYTPTNCWANSGTPLTGAATAVAAPSSIAQAPGASGSISAGAADCTTPNACVSLTLPANYKTVLANVSGTFTSTLQFEGTVDGVTWGSTSGTPVGGGTAVTSATVPGLWVFSTVGLKAIRLHSYSITGGAATVALTATTGVTLTVTLTDAGMNPSSSTFNAVADTTALTNGFASQTTLVVTGATQFSLPILSGTVNVPTTGTSYSIPIKIVDDAGRVFTPVPSPIVITLGDPGTAAGSAVGTANPPEVPVKTSTDVVLTATITDPGKYPPGSVFTVTADLSQVGGGNPSAPFAASGTDASGNQQYTLVVPVAPPVTDLGNTYSIPLTIVDDVPDPLNPPNTRHLTVSPITIGTLPPQVMKLSPLALSFGNQILTTTSTGQDVTVTNIDTAPFTITGISADGDFSQTNTCPASLPAGDSCVVTVKFAPTQAGARTGNLTVTDDAGDPPHLVALTGTGVAAPSMSMIPASLDFGTQIVSSTGNAQTVTLKNTGTANLTISSIAVAPTTDFSYTTTCKANLAPNASCQFTVTFTPTVAGTRTAVLSVTDNASGISDTVSITGSGSDFPVTPIDTTKTVTAGSSATYNLQLLPQGGFNGLVTFTCTGAPQSATCTVLPASLTASGTAGIGVAVSVTTTARPTQTAELKLGTPVVVGSQGGPGSGGPGLPVSVGYFLALALGGVFAVSKKARRQWRVAAVSCALLCVIGMTACAGMKQQPWPTTATPGTPAGTYTVTVTATSGTVTRSTPLTLIVN
jgi:hypothetical protein